MMEMGLRIPNLGNSFVKDKGIMERFTIGGHVELSSDVRLSNFGSGQQGMWVPGSMWQKHMKSSHRPTAN